MKITINHEEGELKIGYKKRKPRSDKRVRSTLRIDRNYHEKIKAIAYNHDQSKQKILDAIIKLVLDNDLLFDKLIGSLPRNYQKQPYLIFRK